MDNRTETPNPLTLLLELGQAFHSTLELDPLLVSILKQLQSALRGDGGSIWLLDDAREVLRCTHAIGPAADQLIGQSVPADAFLEAYSRRGETQSRPTTNNLDAWRARLNSILDLSVQNIITAPLIARANLLGAITITNKIGQPAFSKDDLALLTALAGHAAIAIYNAQLYERQVRVTERQRLLDEISRHLQQTIDLDVLIPRIFAEVNQAIDAEAQSIWLLNAEAGVISCRFATGPNAEAVRKVTVPVGKGIVGTTVEKQQSIMIADAQSDPHFFRGADEKTGLVTRSLLSVPLVREGKSIGAIQAINKRNGALFNQDDLTLFESIADSAALAIENARLFTELQASYDNTLEALAAALDLRDRETEGHSRRVVEYTARIAREIGLDPFNINEIRRGALIHDIGKIGVPDAVLHKPGPLDTDERKVIERHPQAGYEMLLGIPYLQEEIKIVLAHQEKWDGTGYPLGLRGVAIPLGARLFAIADTFDALTSDRPYRKGRSYEAARDIIASEAGKQFDPKAVEAFLAVPSEEWEQIRMLVMEEMGQRRARHAEKVRRGHTGMLNPAVVQNTPR